MRRRAWVVLLCVLFAACTGGGQTNEGRQANGGEGAFPARPEPPAVGVERTITTGLAVPWGLEFVPGGDALITERETARILRVSPNGQTRQVGFVPDALRPGPNEEGGLLGLAVSPRFAEDGAVFVYYTAADGNRLARLTMQGDQLGAPQTLISGIPHAKFHDGGRLAFGPDGMLYIGTGDAKQGELAQDRRSLAGKILRVTPEGLPAPGNPFDGSPVYSYGHRNVEGLAFDSAGGLWASEHGEDTWDELNRVIPGGNYGWPRVEGRAGQDGFIDPAAQWHPADASPAGIAIADDAVYMAALRGERLWRIPLVDGQAGTPEALFAEQFGRLRTVTSAPDGSLWMTTSNRDGRGEPRPADDQVLQLTTK